jgi:hypothetical protein
VLTDEAALDGEAKAGLEETKGRMEAVATTDATRQKALYFTTRGFTIRAYLFAISTVK